MKKVILCSLLVAFMFSTTVNAQEKTKQEPAKTEKACCKKDKKMSCDKDKKSCCSAKKTETKS